MVIGWVGGQAFIAPLGRPLPSTSHYTSSRGPTPLRSTLAERPESETLGDAAAGLGHDRDPEDAAKDQESGRRVYVRLPTPKFSDVTEEQWEEWISLPEREEKAEKERRRLEEEREANGDVDMPEWQKDVLRLEMPRRPQEASARDFYVSEMQVDETSGDPKKKIQRDFLAELGTTTVVGNEGSLDFFSNYAVWDGSQEMGKAEEYLANFGVWNDPVMEMQEADREKEREAREYFNMNGAGVTVGDRRAQAEEEEVNTDFPLSLVEGQEAIKTALLLCAVNPKVGGVIIAGSHGTGKSVMARGLKALLPPIEVVKGSRFNIDPDNPEALDSFLEARLKDTGRKFEDLVREVIPSPFVQVPVSVMEDRLLGSIDLEESIRTGKVTFQPGLLAEAHRGVLYVDDINLMDQTILSILFNCLSQGYVQVEREGISARYPFEPIFLASYCPDGGPLSDFFLDKVGVALSTDMIPLTEEQRRSAIQKVLRWESNKMSAEEVAEIREAEEDLKTRVIFAREEMKEIRFKRAQSVYLCEEAVNAGCEGHRAELFAHEVARAHAAINDRKNPSADDLRVGVKLAIGPRSKFAMRPEDMMMDQMQQPPPPPPQSEMPPDDENQEQQEEQNEEEKEEEEDDDEEPEEAPEEEAIPQDFMFEAEKVDMDSELLQSNTKSSQGRSGRRGSLVYSWQRGRFIKAMIPRTRKGWKIDISGTLRASAPYQRSRQARYMGTDKEGRTIYIEKSDFRAKMLARRAGGVIIFVVDASGSMALNRMNAAKGAALSLLNEAYKSRDKVALISFQGDRATVLLPPTRSIAMAKNRLETMPCGGGSPLAHAFNLAIETGEGAMKRGDVGNAVVVCISDGRANVPLAKSLELALTEEDKAALEQKPDREAIKTEVLQMAQLVGVTQGFSLLVVDTENKFVSTGMAKEIASAAQGKYHFIPKATDRAVAEVASMAIKDMKQGMNRRAGSNR